MKTKNKIQYGDIVDQNTGEFIPYNDPRVKDIYDKWDREYLDFVENIFNDEIITKGLFKTDLKKGIKIWINPRDHLPIHFHVESTQANLKAKIKVYPLELLDLIRGKEKDVDYVIKELSGKKNILNQIEKRFMELNPNLDYENKK